MLWFSIDFSQFYRPASTKPTKNENVSMVATQFRKRKFRTLEDFSATLSGFFRTSESQYYGHFRTIFNIWSIYYDTKPKISRAYINLAKTFSRPINLFPMGGAILARAF